MNGKLIGITFNGEQIDFHPGKAFVIEHNPEPVAWTSIPHQDGIDFKAGDEIDGVEFGDQVFRGKVREVKAKEVIIDLYL